MPRIPPFRQYLIDDDPKPGSRWWHWHPDLFSNREKKYDEEVRLLYGISVDKPIPESLKALPTPPPLTQAEQAESDDFLSRPTISYVNHSTPEPKITWRYRLRYSNAGMYFRYSIMEPLSDKFVVIATGIVIAPIFVLSLIYIVIHSPYRLLRSLIRKRLYVNG